MDLFLVDGIGSFFRGYGRKTVNWSKVPFPHLERGGRLDPDRAAQVLAEFDRFAATAASVGFNAVTLDDAAHLIDSPWYPADLRRLIADYRDLLRDLIACAEAHGLRVFRTSDSMFYNEVLRRRLGCRHRRPPPSRAWCRTSCRGRTSQGERSEESGAPSSVRPTPKCRQNGRS